MSSNKFLDALQVLKIPAGGIVRYSKVAEQIDFVPRRIVKGKETKTLLKVGSQKYKEAIQNEVVKRADKILEKKAQVAKAVKDAVAAREASAQIVPRRIEKKVLQKLSAINYTEELVRYENNMSFKDLYNAIVRELETDRNANYVTIAFRDSERNIIYWRTFSVDAFDTLQSFRKEYNAITKGEYGSDAINTDDNIPDYNLFTIRTLGGYGQYGKSDAMLFETRMIESKENLCAELCLNACGYSATQFGKKPSDLRNFDELQELIVSERLPIEVYSNAFRLTNSLRDIVCDERKHTIKAKMGKRERDFVVADLQQEDIGTVPLYNGNSRTLAMLTANSVAIERNEKLPYDKIPEWVKIKHTLIYDAENQHIDYVDGGLRLCKDLKISISGNVIRNGKVIFTPKTMSYQNNTRRPCNYEYLFFDYETVIDFNASSCMQPYSISILKLSRDQLDRLDSLDASGCYEDISAFRYGKCHTFLGYDCGMQFLEWFRENSINKTFILVGFNNTNFDNFLLLEDFLKYNQEHQETPFNVGEIFYNGSQLLNFKIDGRHNFFDIRKHLVGSLKANCDSFKIKSCAKKSFDHAKAQSLHDEGRLLEFIHGNDELQDYNEHDVLATAVLFRRYQKALEEIDATKVYAAKLHDIKTIGSLIYKVFEDNKSRLNFQLPKLNYQQYTDMQRSKIAGRVEMFNGVQEVTERLASTDVCSLYPFVMSVLNVHYPCGKTLREVDSYQGDDVLGFYYCDIDQSNLRGMDLPNIYAKKSELQNDWDYTGVLENYLISNVMVGLLLKFGCSVVIKSGFVFTEKKKSCEMFGFLLDMMQAKNKQDGLKGRDGYNPALRETLKLLMNSLSGKVIEGLHTEKTVDVDSVSDYVKIKEKATSINFVNAIGGKLFMTYEVDPESICAQQQRPIYLGVLIYDYAKRYMYENSYSRIGKSKLLYTDTDASKFRYRDFLNWKKWVDEENVIVPHWPEVEAKDPRYATHKIYEHGSKVFGSFEDELEDYIGDSYVFYCLEKKSWLYSWVVDGKVKSKYRFKGLNGSAQLLSLDEPFIDKRVINRTNKLTGEVETEEKYFVKPESEYEVYRYYEDHKRNNIESGNELKFFQQVYTTGTAYVLNSSFRKIVKNSARNVELEDSDCYNGLMNKVQVNYMMKRINISR